MGLFSRRPGATMSAPMGSLTASASVAVPDPLTTQGQGMQRGRDAALWEFQRDVGELSAVVVWIGNCMSRIRLVPGWLDEDDEPGPLWDEDGKILPDIPEGLALLARELLRQLRADTGGQSRLMSRFGRILTMTGQSYLVGMSTMGPGPDGPVELSKSFEVLSTSELQPIPGAMPGRSQWRRIMAPGRPPIDLAPNTFVVRVWDDDAEWSQVAFSSVAAVSDVLEENVLLTRQVRAEALSRLMNGVFAVPTTMKPAYEDPAKPPGMDTVTWELLQVAGAVIRDKGHPASMIPVVMRADREDIQAMQHISFAAADSPTSILKRAETVTRIAQGLPVVPERVTGHQGSTFANAATIGEDEFRTYIEPRVLVPVEAVTLQYLRPGLMAAVLANKSLGSPADVDRFCCWYDANKLVVHPNRESAVEHAYGTARTPNFGVSADAYRKYKGFTDADKPDEDEKAERIAIADALNARRTVQETPGSDPAQNPGVDGTVPAPAAASGQPVNPEASSDRLVFTLLAAGEQAVERAVDKVGARLRQKLSSKSALSADLAKLSNVELLRRVGASAATSTLNGDDPLRSEFQVSVGLGERWARQAGVADPGKVGQRYGVMLEAVARQRLFGPAPLTDAQIRAVIAGPWHAGP